MADWQAYSEGWDYDLWANKLWLDCLMRKGSIEPDMSILGHILSAQKIWLTRCYGTSLDAMPVVVPTEESMTQLCLQWQDALREFSHDPIISYHRTTGEPLSTAFSAIVRHTQNHGTYHRGELRGLCKARGDEDFPETDWGRFVFFRPTS